MYNALEKCIAGTWQDGEVSLSLVDAQAVGQFTAVETGVAEHRIHDYQQLVLGGEEVAVGHL